MSTEWDTSIWMGPPLGHNNYHVSWIGPKNALTQSDNGRIIYNQRFPLGGEWWAMTQIGYRLAVSDLMRYLNWGEATFDLADIEYGVRSC
jgi:hypothetical protein